MRNKRLLAATFFMLLMLTVGLAEEDESTKKVESSGTLAETQEFDKPAILDTKSDSKIKESGGTLTEEELLISEKPSVATEPQNKYAAKGGELTVAEQQTFEKSESLPQRKVVLEGGQVPESEVMLFKKKDTETEQEFIFTKSGKGGQLSASESIAFEKKAIVVQTDAKMKAAGDKLYMNDLEVKILPDVASERALEVLQVKEVKIELKDVGKPVYEITGKRKGKLLLLWQTEVQVSAEIDGQTGLIVRSKKPWWGFLVRE